jgi:SNF2-related domain
MTSEDIQRFDVIIVSYSKLAAEYSFLTRQEDPLKRSYTAKPTSILSPVHEQKYRPFQGMFLDESQVVKSTATVIHKAVDSVFRRSTQCLTGTLLHNRWDDAYGNIRLLSGHPVQSQKFFYGTFGSFDYITGKAVPPKPSQMKKLQKFLMAFTFVRPNTVLRLPPHEFKKVEFELRIEDLRESNQHVVNFKNRPQGGKTRHSLDVAKERQMSMGSLIRAQQYACHSWLTRATSKEAQDVENAPPTKTKARRANKTKKTKKYGMKKSQFTRPKAYLEFLKGKLSDSTGRDDEKKFEQWDAKSDISVGSNDSVWSKDGIEDELADLQAEARTYEYNPNSTFAHHEDDQIADRDSEVEELALQSEDHEFLPQIGGKSYENSKKWIDDMVKEDALLRSGRMQCFLKEYRRIITCVPTHRDLYTILTI